MEASKKLLNGGESTNILDLTIECVIKAELYRIAEIVLKKLGRSTFRIIRRIESTKQRNRCTTTTDLH